MYSTLYTVIGDVSRVHRSMLAHFASVLRTVEEQDCTEEGEQSFLLRFGDETWFKYSINSNPNFINQHTMDMQSYFAQAPLENALVKERALAQMGVFNCAVGCEFEENDDEQRTNYIISALFAVAAEINALLLTPAMELYTPTGQLLISITGESELTEYTPIGNADLLDFGKQERPADVARRERSFAFLREREIPFLPTLRAAVLEAEAVLRTPQQIAERLLSIFAVAVYSEALFSGESHAEAQKYLDAVDEMLGGTLKDCLTQGERVYLSMTEPDEKIMAKFSWRYECCLVLLWALGLWEQLPYPQEICDVSAIAKFLWNIEHIEELMEQARPRSLESVLEEADCILRLDWACVNARVHGKDAPSALEPGVVYERHYALNWLVGANQNAAWDDVTPNT